MTDGSVQISITIKVAECERKFEEEIKPEVIEETLQRMAMSNRDR